MVEVIGSLDISQTTGCQFFNGPAGYIYNRATITWYHRDETQTNWNLGTICWGDIIEKFNIKNPPDVPTFNNLIPYFLSLYGSFYYNGTLYTTPTVPPTTQPPTTQPPTTQPPTTQPPVEQRYDCINNSCVQNNTGSYSNLWSCKLVCGSTQPTQPTQPSGCLSNQIPILGNCYDKNTVLLVGGGALLLIILMR